MTTYTVNNGPHTVTGGVGEDILDITYTVPGEVTLSFTGNEVTGYSGTFDYVPGAADVQFSGIERFKVNLAGGDHNDSVFTGDGDDTLLAGDGDDVFGTGAGIDVVDGGAGLDRWFANLGAVVDDIEIDLTDAAPQTFLETGSVTGVEAFGVNFGSGDDRLVATDAPLRDFIDAGGGDDIVTMPVATDGAVSDETVLGGSGTDILVVTNGFGTGVVMTLSADIDGGYQGRVDGEGNNDLAFYTFERFGFTDTGGGDDQVVTGPGRDTIDGGGGNDTLDSGGGSDIVDGGAGNDIWRADKSFATAADEDQPRQGRSPDLFRRRQCRQRRGHAAEDRLGQRPAGRHGPHPQRHHRDRRRQGHDHPAPGRRRLRERRRREGRPDRRLQPGGRASRWR